MLRRHRTAAQSAGATDIKATVVDLFLPDSQGIETFDLLFRASPHIPILVLSSPRDEDVARLAVQHGAQDYLLKDCLDGYTLPKAVTQHARALGASEALLLEEERAQVTLDSIGDAVVSTDVAGNVTYLNPVAERMTGWCRQEACGRPLQEVLRIIDADSREPALNPLALAILKDKTVGLSGNCVLIRRDGYESAIEDSAAPIHDRRGQVTGAVIVFHDVGVARAMSLKMSHLAQHDTLTGLPNRVLLNDRLNQAIEMARRHRQSLAVLYVDVDRFKHINDSLGHAVGDRFCSRSHVAWWPACAARTPSADPAVTNSWCCFRKWLARKMPFALRTRYWRQWPLRIGSTSWICTSQ